MEYEEPEAGDKAEQAGADFVGAEDIVEKISGGWLDFDTLIATPDAMGMLGKLGKVLGPKGLMPNPKTGTVTMDVTQAVKDSKAGKVNYRTDKQGNAHITFGKVSFETEKLVENYNTIYNLIVRAKPAAAKGVYIKNIAVSSTMGPSVKVNG